MLLSNRALYESIKSRFIKEKKTRKLLSSLGIKTPLSKISLIVLFCFKGISKLIQGMQMIK